MIKVLIFGASGFIGTNLVKKLSDIENIKVTATYLNNRPKIKYCNVKYVKINLTNYNNFRNKFSKVDFIIHLAADRDPFLRGVKGKEQIKKNQLITENICKLACKINCKNIIYISSVYIYSGTKDKKFKEDSLLDPIESLGKSKLACETVLKRYSKKGFFKCLSIRLFTVYGIGASQKQFVEIAMNKIKSKKNIINFRNGTIKRDMIYIDDVTQCIYLAIIKFKKNISKHFLPLNLGYGRSFKIKTIVKIICNSLKIDKKVRYSNKTYKIGDSDHLSDITLLKKMYAWSPKISFKSGFLKMIKRKSNIEKKI
tara:strand:+ start:952 stop:1887 length:936 start_codon:yes stop_codon:yes gene_type:complete